VPVVTLIGSPLDRGLAEDVRARWRGGATDWLSPGHALSFAVPAMPADADADAVGCELRANGCDLAVQHRSRRREVLLADMDGTMIGQECIDELADIAGVGQAVAAITARAMNGEIDFDGALQARVALLAGLDAGAIDRVWNERISLAPGARTLLATMRAHGAHAALVSGGFTVFTARVAAALGFDEHRANALPVIDGRITGKVAEPILGRDAKVATLHEICRRIGCAADDVLAVGDGANDLAMLNSAGCGVALHAKPAVAGAAPIRIDHADLTSLLFLQGYREADFVTPEG
jgi:phosphoserine phosphatase